MSQIGDNNYGDTFADIYDQIFEGRDDLNLVGDQLARLAGAGPVLEFGIGTGRLALPLVERGLKVYGIDNSSAMLELLKQKPGAEHIVPILGDCAETKVDETFSLVFIGFSTLFMLGSQETQIRCFQNAAHHLPVGGKFVVEGFIHDRSLWQNGQEVVTTRVTEERIGLRVGVLDSLQQLIRIQHVDISPDGIRLRPIRLRFAYPSEIDLMGRLTGFRLLHRWSDWSGAPLTSTSTWQVSTYEKVSETAI